MTEITTLSGKNKIFKKLCSNNFLQKNIKLIYQQKYFLLYTVEAMKPKQNFDTNFKITLTKLT